MQQCFLNPSSHAFVPSSPSIVAGQVALSELFKKKKLPVFCTRHINNIGYEGMMAYWWKNLITENNEHSKLIPEIQNIEAPVYHKQEYDAFYKTGLEEVLNNNGIKKLIVTGVMTHLCVETTVRSAFVRGFQPILPVNGTATYNEEFHKASLVNLSHGFAILTTMEVLINSLRSAIIE